MIPVWFLFALGSSVCSALGMYMLQRMNGSGVATAVWLKIFAVLIAGPVLLQVGLPDQPMFYLLTAAAAAIWCINDPIYFRAVTGHGAALLARLAPLGIILGFVAWFMVKPGLLHHYLEDMPRFLAICATLLVTVGCSAFLSRCRVSMSALKAIWFVIFSSVVGIIFMKSAVDYAQKNQGVFGYVGFEALIMLVFYAGWFLLRRKEGWKEVFSRRGFKTGGTVGLLMIGAVICRAYAYKTVDIPAFVTMISMLDAIWLIPMTRLSGWKDDSNKLAGLGIVAAAIALAFLKLR